jgi:hypothetical protein
MNEGRERRLARLERRRRRKPRRIIVWWDAARETADQAMARQFPEGPPEDAEILFVRWLIPGEEKEQALG